MQNRKQMIKAIVFGVISALLISIILLCIVSAVVMTSGLLPAELTNIITVAMLGIGTLAGAFIAARITKSAGLIIGASTGFAVFMVITIAGLIKSSESLTYITLIRFAVTLIMGIIGGIIGVNKKEKLKIK